MLVCKRREKEKKQQNTRKIATKCKVRHLSHLPERMTFYYPLAYYHTAHVRRTLRGQ
uniref:Uncharacterized protein n=1 Tax=Anopheles quadriannulatus TaxID=34691 RepID=A0A182XQX0_ANOQN